MKRSSRADRRTRRKFRGGYSVGSYRGKHLTMGRNVKIDARSESYAFALRFHIVETVITKLISGPSIRVFILISIFRRPDRFRPDSRAEETLTR
jgi:hypothetical protein